MTDMALVPFVDDSADRIADLEREVARLKRDLRTAQADADNARDTADHALSALRRQLTPLYRALQGVFGELDAAGVSDEPQSPTTHAGHAPPNSDRMRSVWESWKSKLGKGEGRVIDALLTHGELNTTQLSIATGDHRNNIPSFIYKLNKAGLINKNGGKFSLKSLG